MGRTRSKYFGIDSISESVDFGTYALTMYYAKQLNSAKAKVLFDATLSEWKYRVNYDLPVGNLDGTDDLEAHFVPAEVQEAIAFIDGELVPALNNEQQDLLLKYGDRNHFRELFYINPNYLQDIGVNDNELYIDDPGYIVGFLKHLQTIYPQNF